MISSAFNRFIIFEKETSSKNAVGTPTEPYTFLKETWANFRLLSGGTQFTQEAGLPYSDVEFTIRYDPDINYACRIVFDNQYYRIQHIFTEGRMDFTKIRCKVWEGENFGN
jgi:SPP1 family predicted phage head-tail adaptor